MVLGLAAVQVLLALWLYRKLPLAGSPPRPVRPAHRILGFALFAVTVPIAVHCLLAYGVQLSSARVAVHSLAGCFFYGAFTAKVLLVQSRRLPGWALPAAGGALDTWSPFSGTPPPCGTTTATSSPECNYGNHARARTSASGGAAGAGGGRAAGPGLGRSPLIARR